MKAAPLVGPAALAGWPAYLVCVGLLLIFTMPAALLDLLGLGYASVSGNPVSKIHPGTDLVLLAVAIAAARSGNPFRYLAAQANRFPGAVALLAATALLIVYLAKVQGAPFTPLFDTFVLPALLLPLLADLPPKPRAIAQTGLHTFFAVNAVLGIIEFATSWRLIPMNFDGTEITTEMEWRASGLLGHPLSSATMAGIYCVILALGAGTSMPAWLRGPAAALQFASLAAFGGRTALVMTTAILAVLLVLRGGDLLRGRRFSRRTCAVSLVVAVAFAIGATILVRFGFFDQLLQRFVDDNGSAKSRAIIFDVFSHLSWQELWLGPDQDHLATVLHLEGIEVGVESFWLGFVVLCGIWMSSLLFIAFAIYLWDVMRRVDMRATVPLIIYLAFISTTVSLSVKNASLSEFVAIVMVLMPNSERARVPARPLAHAWRPA
jgi:hypothetical protein